MPELIPCPFCGDHEGVYLDGRCDDHPYSALVRCSGCNAVHCHNNEADAIAAWNRRSVVACSGDTEIRVAEAIMQRVDDFKTVAVNGYDDPGLRELLLSATREVLAAFPALEPTPSPTGTEQALAQAKGHIAILTAFWMDNPYWTEATAAARSFLSSVPEQEGL